MAPQRIGRLGRGPHDELADGVVLVGHNPARLHRRARSPVLTEGYPHHAVGAGEGALDVPVRGLQLSHQVGVGVGVGERRLGIERGVVMHDGVEDLVVDHDQFGRVHGGASILGDHHRQRLAHVADLVSGQGEGLEAVDDDRSGEQVRHGLVEAQVGGGEHTEHERGPGRLRGVDAPQAGVGLGTAHEHRMGGSHPGEIVHVAPRPGDQAPVLHSP